MGRSRMRLTTELVARVPRWSEEEPLGEMPEGHRFATDADYAEITRTLLARAPGDDVWLFAYGSLIWNPCFDFVEQRGATALGWHRSFCLGWDDWFRGCVARPGLMLALDRGGSCKGAAFRLPPNAVEANLDALLRREVHIIPNPLPPRWIDLVTEQGRIRAVTFVIDRAGELYQGRRPGEEVAASLAVASGQWGSMAEYLFQTVSRLEEMDVHDRHLWHLQALVADHLERMTGTA